jgi:WD40 repeat protein
MWIEVSWTEVLTLREGKSLSAAAVAFSKDGSRLATVVNNTAKIWDARSATEVLNLRGHSRNVDGVAFSSNGCRLFSQDESGLNRVWDVATGKPVNEIPPANRFPKQFKVARHGTSMAICDGIDIKLYVSSRQWRYDPWAEDAYRRRAWAVTWHAEDAELAAAKGDAFAMKFHLRWLGKLPIDNFKDIECRVLCLLHLAVNSFSGN